MLSDLRESGAIEQDADIVSFIYRPEYYGFLQDEEGNSNAGVGEIIIAKHRNGALENVRLRFIKEFARFDNIEGFQDEGTTMIDAGLAANNSFDNKESYTISSKMNSNENDDNLDFNSSIDDDNPF